MQTVMPGIKHSDFGSTVTVRGSRPPAMMMMMMMPALLSAALLLLPETLTEDRKEVPIDVAVENSLLGDTPVTYRAHAAVGGILLGAMKRLMESNSDFKFSYTEHPDYGHYLESVNGVTGNDEDHTYWELLVKTVDGKITRPNVGIGCYVPSENEKIILKFTKW